jgi:Icc protein
MIFIFITDLHTGQEGELAHNIDLRQNFLDTLAAITKRPYDYLIIGGDLCLFEGNAQIYQWQKEQLDRLAKPYFIIPGNHDDTILLSELFNHLPLVGEAEIYYEVLIDHKTYLFLDTARGMTSDLQKSWLKERLANCEEERITIFMHHPPALMGVSHMDQRHALKDRDEIIAILNLTNIHKDIFCGHYHVQKSVFMDRISIHITPSLFFQIDQLKEEFAVDHLNIAYNVIEIKEDLMTTSMHYLPGNLV